MRCSPHGQWEEGEIRHSLTSARGGRAGRRLDAGGHPDPSPTIPLDRGPDAGPARGLRGREGIQPGVGRRIGHLARPPERGGQRGAQDHKGRFPAPQRLGEGRRAGDLRAQDAFDLLTTCPGHQAAAGNSGGVDDPVDASPTRFDIIHQSAKRLAIGDVQRGRAHPRPVSHQRGDGRPLRGAGLPAGDEYQPRLVDARQLPRQRQAHASEPARDQVHSLPPEPRRPFLGTAGGHFAEGAPPELAVPQRERARSPSGELAAARTARKDRSSRAAGVEAERLRLEGAILVREDRANGIQIGESGGWRRVRAAGVRHGKQELDRLPGPRRRQRAEVGKQGIQTARVIRRSARGKTQRGQVPSPRRNRLVARQLRQRAFQFRPDRASDELDPGGAQGLQPACFDGAAAMKDHHGVPSLGFVAPRGQALPAREVKPRVQRQLDRGLGLRRRPVRCFLGRLHPTNLAIEHVSGQRDAPKRSPAAAARQPRRVRPSAKLWQRRESMREFPVPGKAFGARLAVAGKELALPVGQE